LRLEKLHRRNWIQPFSEKSRTPAVGKEFPIGLYDPAGITTLPVDERSFACFAPFE